MASTMNYGDSTNGAHMLGHPDFRKVCPWTQAREGRARAVRGGGC